MEETPRNLTGRTGLKTAMLLLIYFSLQMGGQILARISGEIGSIFNGYTLGSYACLLARGFLWVLILGRLKIIAAYPLNGLIYLAIIPVSHFLFNESTGPARITGAAVTAAGVILLTMGEEFQKRSTDRKRGFHQ